VDSASVVRQGEHVAETAHLMVDRKQRKREYRKNPGKDTVPKNTSLVAYFLH
jgi:hypothetical protein